VSRLIGEVSDWIRYRPREVFNRVLDRTRVKIYTEDGVITRDLREQPYSAGITYYPRSKQGWYVAVIRCDDAKNPEWIDGKTDVYYPMFYSPTFNPDYVMNKWSRDTPVVVVDCCLAGAYYKEILVDGNPLPRYHTAFMWIHYNLRTGEVWVG